MESDVHHAPPEGGVAIQQAKLLAQAEPVQQGLGLFLQTHPGLARAYIVNLGVLLSLAILPGWVDRGSDGVAYGFHPVGATCAAPG